MTDLAEMNARVQAMADPLPRLALQSITAAELMAVDFPEPRWAVPNLVPQGVTLLCGAPKVGKSWLALGIGVAVASGGKALGRVDCTPGDVLYLALEDVPRRLQSRLSMVLGTDTAPDRLHMAVECGRMPDAADLIGEWVARFPDARMVVVDVLTRIRGPRTIDASAYEADYSAMAGLKAVADAHGIAMMVVHHVRKATSEDFLDAVSGTHGLAGAADAVAVLARTRGTADATLSVTGRDTPEACHALSFDATTGTWQLLEGDATLWAVHDTRARILRHLHDIEGASAKQIAADLGISHANARQTLRRMLDDSQLDSDGNGVYFLPAEPLSHVTAVTCHTPSDAVTPVTQDQCGGTDHAA